eukprot:snap_masked-scaffold_11-processed-gene-6.38-mRNA-1 protein AED:1.00 eAED:1.00 QI:0/0/0/0/1/1/2/0/160
MNGRVSSTFPLPPIYFKYYSDENLQKRNPETHDLAISLKPPQTPEDLEEETYQIFGQQWKIREKDANLTEFGLEVLYDEENTNQGEEVKKLVEMLYETYIKVIDQEPGQEAQKEYDENLKKFDLLLTNIIETQGKAQLIEILKKENDEKRKVLQELKEAM